MRASLTSVCLIAATLAPVTLSKIAHAADVCPSPADATTGYVLTQPDDKIILSVANFAHPTVKAREVVRKGKATYIVDSSYYQGLLRLSQMVQRESGKGRPVSVRIEYRQDIAKLFPLKVGQTITLDMRLTTSVGRPRTKQGMLKVLKETEAKVGACTYPALTVELTYQASKAVLQRTTTTYVPSMKMVTDILNETIKEGKIERSERNAYVRIEKYVAKPMSMKLIAPKPKPKQ